MPAGPRSTLDHRQGLGVKRYLMAFKANRAHGNEPGSTHKRIDPSTRDCACRFYCTVTLTVPRTGSDGGLESQDMSEV